MWIYSYILNSYHLKKYFRLVQDSTNTVKEQSDSSMDEINIIVENGLP